DHLSRGRADQLRDVRPCGLDRFSRAPTPGVGGARWVPELLLEIGEHRFEDTRVEGRGRVMIEIDLHESGRKRSGTDRAESPWGGASIGAERHARRRIHEYGIRSESRTV